MSDNDLIRRGDALALPYRLSPSLDASDGYYVSVDAIRTLPAAQVTVKPLEWEPFGTECVRSYSVAGRYEVIWGFRSGQVCLDMRGATMWFESTEAAKAAAQADYDARICSALTVTPHDPAKVQALVEAAKRVSFNYHHGNGLEELWAGFDALDATLAQIKEV